MTGNQRVRNSLQSSLLKINVCTANFREFDCEQSRVSFQLRGRDLAQFDRRIWLRDNSDERHEDRYRTRSGSDGVQPSNSVGRENEHAHKPPSIILRVSIFSATTICVCSIQRPHRLSKKRPLRVSHPRRGLQVGREKRYGTAAYSHSTNEAISSSF